MTLLHSHRVHRARQLRWVVPIAVLLFVAAAATLLVQYRVSDQAVGTEFFRAHKTVAHTGELLRQGVVAGLVVLTVLVAATAVLALRLTHRIVRPVHTIHRALDALCTGELGVRVELDRTDEFREVGAALNRLVEHFAETLARVHAMVDRLDALAAAAARDGTAEREIHALVHELDGALDFFRLEPRRVIREDAG
ncbi:MAG TPA: HAMP domain-containing protein [Candidatus Binatia bacterium]|nr:HAMP domain-containing protein [Candidatus Binatia bacterium]